MNILIIVVGSILLALYKYRLDKRRYKETLAQVKRLEKARNKRLQEIEDERIEREIEEEKYRHRAKIISETFYKTMGYKASRPDLFDAISADKELLAKHKPMWEAHKVECNKYGAIAFTIEEFALCQEFPMQCKHFELFTPKWRIRKVYE